MQWWTWIQISYKVSLKVHGSFLLLNWQVKAFINECKEGKMERFVLSCQVALDFCLSTWSLRNKSFESQTEDDKPLIPNVFF